MCNLLSAMFLSVLILFFMFCFDFQDNPVMPRLYMTGAFFFIMMYTGSNVLPIAKYVQILYLQCWS